MEVTTYTIKSRQDGFVWVFKYHLNGTLKSFEILDGQLTPKQSQWLFGSGNFPINELIIKQVWAVKLKANFEISVGLPDTSFESFWAIYGQKVKKETSKPLWAKLKEADRIKALDGIRRYNNWLRLHPGIGRKNPDTFLRQRTWEDEF